MPRSARASSGVNDYSDFLRSKATVAEQAQAVLDAGGIESARRRLAPSAYAQLQNEQNERKELA